MLMRAAKNAISQSESGYTYLDNDPRGAKRSGEGTNPETDKAKIQQRVEPPKRGVPMSGGMVLGSYLWQAQRLYKLSDTHVVRVGKIAAFTRIGALPVPMTGSGVRPVKM